MEATMKLLALAIFLIAIPAQSQTSSCSGSMQAISPKQRAMVLDSGGIALFAKMHINADGFGRAYHPRNIAGGGVLHLCNAGEVFLPDGSHYYGSESNETCTGKFMDDYAKIGKAGWKDPSIGVIRWFGVLGKDNVSIGPKNNRRVVKGVTPVIQTNGSGFYVSPTALADESIPSLDRQERYIDATKIPAAVIKSTPELAALGITYGTFGVAIHKRHRLPVPFIVGDEGPRIGEGSVALARLTSGLPAKEIVYRERHQGNIDEANVLWVFFGGTRMSRPFTPERVASAAKDAFSDWGGSVRLIKCFDTPSVPR